MSDREPVPPVRFDEADAEELVVCWKNPDGSVDRGRALRPQNAQEMARIFSRMYPDQTYWLEPPNVTPRGAYTGLQRRHVR